MATLKVISGGSGSGKTSQDPFTFSSSFKNYFMCCFKHDQKSDDQKSKDKKSQDRRTPEGRSEETKLQGLPEGVDNRSSPNFSSKLDQTNEIKEGLRSALSQARGDGGSRPRSVMSVKTVTIEENTDTNNGRISHISANSDKKLITTDNEAINSKFSRPVTHSPILKEDLNMGGEISNQSPSKSIHDNDRKPATELGAQDHNIPDAAAVVVDARSVEAVDEANQTDRDATTTTNVVITSPTPNAQPNKDPHRLETDAEHHLFDVSDLQRVDSNVINYNCGSLCVSIKFEDRACRVLLTVHEAKDIPSKDRGGHSNSQVHGVLLPAKKIRHKTKVLSGDNPIFNYPFDFKIKEEQLAESSVRLRLYGIERLKKNRLIGEVVIPLTPQYLNDLPVWLPLEPRSNLRHGESALSLNSANISESEYSLATGDAMELMLGLSYNSVTGRMAVEVIKGSNFKNGAVNKPPDTYVKIALMAPNQQEINKSKTTVRRGQPNPLFKETFMFQVPRFQLEDVSLLVSVFVIKSLKRKEMLGWFTMGQTSSSDEDLSHWKAVVESKGEQVSRWHNLLEP